jgi:hypothetical protein
MPRKKLWILLAVLGSVKSHVGTEIENFRCKPIVRSLQEYNPHSLWPAMLAASALPVEQQRQCYAAFLHHSPEPVSHVVLGSVGLYLTGASSSERIMLGRAVLELFQKPQSELHRIVAAYDKLGHHEALRALERTLAASPADVVAGVRDLRTLDQWTEYLPDPLEIGFTDAERFEIAKSMGGLPLQTWGTIAEASSSDSGFEEPLPGHGAASVLLTWVGSLARRRYAYLPLMVTSVPTPPGWCDDPNDCPAQVQLNTPYWCSEQNPCDAGDECGLKGINWAVCLPKPTVLPIRTEKPAVLRTYPVMPPPDGNYEINPIIVPRTTSGEQPTNSSHTKAGDGKPGSAGTKGHVQILIQTRRSSVDDTDERYRWRRRR